MKLTSVERTVCALMLLLLLTSSCAPVSGPTTVQPTATSLPSSTPVATPTETARQTDTPTVTSTPTKFPTAIPTPTLVPFADVKQTFGPITISNAANVYVTQPIVSFQAQGDFEVSFGLTSPDKGNDTGNGNARNTFTLDLTNAGRIYVAHNGESWILGVIDPDGTINRSNLGTEKTSPAGMFTLRVLKDRAVVNALVEGVLYATLPIDKLRVFDSSTALTAGVQSAPHAVNIITGAIAVPQTQETNVALRVPTPLPTSTPTRRPAPPATVMLVPDNVPYPAFTDQQKYKEILAQIPTVWDGKGPTGTQLSRVLDLANRGGTRAVKPARPFYRGYGVISDYNSNDRSIAMERQDFEMTTLLQVLKQGMINGAPWEEIQVELQTGEQAVVDVSLTENILIVNAQTTSPPFRAPSPNAIRTNLPAVNPNIWKSGDKMGFMVPNGAPSQFIRNSDGILYRRLQNSGLYIYADGI